MKSLFCRFFWLVLPLLLAPAVWAAPLNVIVLITDDQGYGELSAHGNPVLKTPHLDRLRTESVRFNDFHVAPMCTPTRGQLLTGLDTLRNGAMNVSSSRALLRCELPRSMRERNRSLGFLGGFRTRPVGQMLPLRFFCPDRLE